MENKLPNEIWQAIFGNCHSFKDKINIKLTCKKFNELCQINIHVKMKCYYDYKLDKFKEELKDEMMRSLIRIGDINSLKYYLIWASDCQQLSFIRLAEIFQQLDVLKYLITNYTSYKFVAEKTTPGLMISVGDFCVICGKYNRRWLDGEKKIVLSNGRVAMCEFSDIGIVGLTILHNRLDILKLLDMDKNDIDKYFMFVFAGVLNHYKIAEYLSNNYSITIHDQAIRSLLPDKILELVKKFT